MNQISFSLLLIYSSLTMNLVLQCGLGLKGIAESKSVFNLQAVVKSILIFVSIILLWFFFVKIVFSLVSGIFVYVLLFPVSAIVYDGIEYLVFKYLLRRNREEETFISFPGGTAAVAVFICINLAGGFLEALILAFGFSSGILIINLIIREIRKRAAFETIPLFLRGKPLVLIAMGMLSLIFTAASYLFFRMISAG